MKVLLLFLLCLVLQGSTFRLGSINRASLSLQVSKSIDDYEARLEGIVRVQGSSSEADEIFSELLKNNIQPSKKILELLILVFLQSDDVEEAFRESDQILGQLLRGGDWPSSAVVNAIIELCGSMKRPERAEEVIAKLQFAGMTISLPTFNTLMSTWVGIDPTQVDEVFLRMRYSDIEPNEDSYRQLLEAWSLSTGSTRRRELSSVQVRSLRLSRAAGCWRSGCVARQVDGPRRIPASSAPGESRSLQNQCG